MSTAIGRAAEQVAADFLQADGYAIIAQNWRTRWCEIDIVASKSSTIYFVEVKYRRNDTWGSGLEYITPQKLRQMYFAAKFWQATHAGYNHQLSAIALTGLPPYVHQWVEDIS